MTGRLIKYEIKSGMRLMTVIWAALIAASILFSISIHVLGNIFHDGTPGLGVFLAIVEIVTGLMYFAVFVALIVATLMIVIMRFYKGLLGDEGYLMHTLPIRAWQLITAKGIVAAMVVIISVITAFISLMILAGGGGIGMLPAVWDFMGRIWDEDPRYILVMAEVIILIVLSVLKSIYQIYAALAIGQLANKHRILLALGAYIGMSMLVSAIFMTLAVVADNVGFMGWLGTMFADVENDVFSVSQMAVASFFLMTAVQLAAFHVITERILSLRLNLQ